MDTLTAQVPGVSAEDLQTQFKYETLIKTKSEPAYIAMDEVMDKIYHNVMGIKSPFGGAQHGQLVSVIKPVFSMEQKYSRLNSTHLQKSQLNASNTHRM